ncbi:MAG: alpha/beta fold hydrolase [Verrucomicrobia bacterium]|jgi:pimeloyl-ACP methyl ester carboxylesterase|nr:alpha/beta fold hydrolase [Verrucomicrobiota bacterium]
MRLHSQVVGSGPDVIVLHGLFGSHQNWLPVARGLSGHFRVHTVDLRNHGASPHHRDVNYPLMAEDLRFFMDQAGIRAAHLVGHSLGGKVAMQFALGHGGRVKKLAVADIAPRAYEAVHDEVFEALRGLDLSRLRTRTQADEALAARLPLHALRRFLLTNLTPVPTGGFRWRINLEALFAQREQLTAAVTAATPFEGPTLFLRGERSDYIREADRPAIARLFPRARIETIAHAGHWVHVDAPEPFLNGLLGFLAGPPKPAFASSGEGRA